MLNHLLKAGDRVRMKMDHETRAYSKKAIEDGTLGTVIGRYRATGIIEARYPVSPFREPGIYAKDSSPIVIWDEYPEGADPTDMEYNHVTATHLEPADTFYKEYKLRYETEWAVRLPDGKMDPNFCTIKEGYRLDNLERIGDLPETPFWELDVVRYRGDRYRITRINYNQWGPEKEHCYNMEEIGDDGIYLRNGSLTVDPNHLTLVERGNVWRALHGEPLVFHTLEEEVSFAKGMGRTHEVRNPKHNLYTWTLDEILDAIRGGLVDGFTNEQLMFADKRNISGTKFDDRDLGERIRRQTLKGFAISI